MKKRFLVLLVAAVVLIAAFGMVALAQEKEPQDGCYEHGDINGDGVVDQQDAVYALYHSFPLVADQYPVNQSLDFNLDGTEDDRDAVYLMHAAAGEEGYALKGTVHNYGQIRWEWTVENGNVSVQASVPCSCGENLLFTEGSGITVTEGSMVEPGCTTVGTVEYFARVTVNGKLENSIYTRIVEALGGHDFPEGPCDQEIQCTRCEAVRPAGSHAMELSADSNLTYEANCTKTGNEHYVCANCGETEDVELAVVPHAYVYLESRQLSGCRWARYYRCANCDLEPVMGEKEGDTFLQHSYTAELTREPNCTEGGLKTYTCVCGDSYSETVASNAELHVWGETGTAIGDTVTYTCIYNEAHTKTVVQVSSGAAVTKDALAGDGVEIRNSGEAVDGASLKLDESALEGLKDESVTVSVKEADLSGMKLPEGAQEQIGGNTVYDFSLTNGGESVSEFEGQVTISLPYTLQDGDDVDAIDVWFIADDGSLTIQQGTYSNGFVTFTTNHFSYYTVTRLTAAQRCGFYGHVMPAEATVTAPTCTGAGFDLTTCARCGYGEKSNEQPKLQHRYELTSGCVEATCDAPGLEEKICALCGDMRAKTLPATGHKHEKKADACVEATCDAPGKNVFVCTCGDTYETEVAQLTHKFLKSEEGSMAVDCEVTGYELYVCQHCGSEEQRNVQSPTGHQWKPSAEGWVWNEDHSKATLTLVCANKGTHERVLNGVISKKTETSVCLGGAVTYTAVASYLKETYTDTVTVNVEAPGHVPAAVWTYDEQGHSRECMVCKEVMDEGTHTFSEAVTKAPTCIRSGILTKTCDHCGYAVNSPLAATGIHNYVSGACTDCGLKEIGCDHLITHMVSLNLEDYGACQGTLHFFSCDCGMVTMEADNNYMSYSCEWEEYPAEGGFTEDLLNSTVTHKRVCTKCGLVRKNIQYQRISDTMCGLEHVDKLELSMDGVSFVEYETIYHTRQHYAYKVEKTYALDGTVSCGGLLEQLTCDCGKGKGVRLLLECRNLVYDGETNTTVCGDCSTIIGEEYVGGYEDGCAYVEKGNVVVCAGGRQGTIYNLENLQYMSNHDFEITNHTLLGETCEDGITVFNKCARCGEDNWYTTTSHAQVNRKRTDLEGNGGCAVALVEGTCPCPVAWNYSYFEYDAQYHTWAHDVYEENYQHANCENCGWEWSCNVTYGQKDADCNVTVITNNTYTDGKGTTISFANQEYRVLHDMEYTDTVLGESCEDGVERQGVCRDCGTKQAKQTYYHHLYTELQSLELTGIESCVDGFMLVGCPCGQERWVEFHSENGGYCQMSGYEENGVICMTCEVCGLEQRSEERLLGALDACSDKTLNRYTFLMDNVELGKLEFDSVRSHHQTRTEITLVSGEDDCTKGTYEIKQTCSLCGDMISQWTAPPEESHYPMELSRETLTQGQLCGELDLMTDGCRCGQIEYTYEIWRDGGCQFMWEGEQNGYQIWRCANCGVIRKTKNSSSLVEGETCRTQEVSNNVFTKDGKTVLAYETVTYRMNHQQVYTFPENAQCGSEFEAVYNCIKCGASGTTWVGGHGGHSLFPVDWIDVAAAGGCDTSFVLTHCACGKISYLELHEQCRFEERWNEYTDDAGTYHSTWLRTCTVCGLEETRDRVYGDTVNCERQMTYVYTFKLGDKLNRTLEFSTVEEAHAMDVSNLSLVNPGTTCEEGVRVTEQCKYCDHGYDYIANYHVTIVNATVDLAPYGAVCGATLESRSCICGRSRSFDITDDSKCDIWQTSCEPFAVEGEVVSEGYEYGVTSGYWLDAIYEKRDCAVTDPQCGLKIRYAKVWLREGCEVVQYEIWMLGYNEETGTCGRMLKEPTGQRMSYHAYEVKETVTGEPGNQTINRAMTCPNCDSSLTVVNVYGQHGIIRSERVAINTVCANEPTYYRNVADMICVLGVDGEYYPMTTYQKTDVTEQDGTSYWYEETISYNDPGNPCIGDQVYVNSDGIEQSQRSEYHTFSWHNGEWIRHTSCSQNGVIPEWIECHICGQITQYREQNYDPTGHIWSAVSDGYECLRCGLEGTNGADGAIVLEDLTEENSAETVVGYWNKDGINVHLALSVILYDAAEGADDELLLQSVDIRYLTVESDGVRAVAWNTAAAQSAAEAAIAQAGYKGSYALRLTFVPQSGVHELDYAITFDTQVAE